MWNMVVAKSCRGKLFNGKIGGAKYWTAWDWGEALIHEFRGKFFLKFHDECADDI